MTRDRFYRRLDDRERPFYEHRLAGITGDNSPPVNAIPPAIAALRQGAIEGGRKVAQGTLIEFSSQPENIATIIEVVVRDVVSNRAAER